MAWKKTPVILFSFVILLFIGTPVVSYTYYANALGDKNYLLNKNDSGLVLMDRDGKAFFTFYQAKKEDYITLSFIPKYVQQAVVSTEDKDFYDNPGFSVRGMGRAFLVNFKQGKIVQGGSTISQGLIKNTLLTPKRSFLRKFQELTLSYALNKQYSKDDILEMYLNSAYFGEGAFGINSAAQTYFGVDADKLDLAQGATLIGLLPAPSAYSPLTNDPEIAENRKQIVLEEMLSSGFITESEAIEAADKKIVYNPQKEEINILAPHFAIMVRDALIKKYGEEFVVRSGLKVKTSLKSDWQEFAQDTVKSQVAKLNSNNAFNGAAVVIDAKTSEVLVMVGSIDWHNNQFGKVNMATTPRQSGSAFKPIIYAEALERKLITPATILKDNPTTFPGNYKPENYDNRFRGNVTVRRALANSLNVPSVEVMQKLGVENGLKAAEKLGITTLGNDTSNYGLSLVLGTGEVPLVELTNAYAAFANGGNVQPYTVILEVKNKFGKVIETANSSPKKAVSRETAFLISSILSDTRTRSEVFGNSLNTNRITAIKTGTTQSYRDALTVGYTNDLAVGVWVGNNDNTQMDKIAGSLGAAPTLKLLIENFAKNYPDVAFAKPESVVQVRVCPQTNVATPSAFTEFAIRGTLTNQNCAPREVVQPTDIPEGETPETPPSDDAPSPETIEETVPAQSIPEPPEETAPPPL